MKAASKRSTTLVQLASDIHDCQRCVRLVDWTRQVARDKRAAYRNETYWGRPVAGFGDPNARIVVLGLAPGAHGANRTGRVFTGDRSGEWLYRALHRAGLANQPTSVHGGDGLELTDVWVTVAVRCAPPGNKPTPEERTQCLPFLSRELAALDQTKVIVCLGAFALQTIAGLREVVPKPMFAHGAVYHIGQYTIVCSYHPSQQNTFTGKLTESMLDDVFVEAVRLARR